MTAINNLSSTDELDPTDQFPLWSGLNGASRRIAYGDFLSELMKDANPMTTLGDVIFGIAKGVQARLPIGANGQVLGVVGGVPAWTTAAAGGFTNPMTTIGDLIVGGVSGAATRYASSTSGFVLTANGVGVAPTWQAVPSGFTNPMTTAGDMILGGVAGAAGRIGIGSDGQVLTVSGGTPAWVAAGGGLTNWTEAVNTSAPNATIPVVSFTVSNAATNVDAAIVPKGLGAILAKVSTGSTTTGNKRGSSAVDFQLDTGSVAANVASGTTSFLIGGSTNRATGTNSGVAGGAQNTASGAAAFVGGGNTNTASSANSAVLGGNGNVASTSNWAVVVGGNTNISSGTASVVVGGDTNTADSAYSVAFGNRALVRGMLGAHARSSAQPLAGSAGTRQARDATLQANTASNTATPLTVNGSAAGVTNQFNLVTGSGLKVRAQVMVRNNANGDCGWWDISGACKNVSGTVTLSGTPVVSAYAGDASLNTCLVAIVADNTNKCLQVQVTGIAATALIWVAESTSVEIVT